MKNHSERIIQIRMNIAFFRKQKGMTQSKLAEKAGISVAQIKYMESLNTDQKITLEDLFDVADAMGIEPYKFLEF